MKKKKKTQNKITIELTETQAFLIEMALDYCSRVSAGQVHHVSDIVDLGQDQMRKVILPNGEEGAMFKLGSWIEDTIKHVLFPELQRNESYGVGNKEIPNAQIMYEMVTVFQNYRAEKDNHSQSSVTWHRPLHYSKEPLIKIKEIKNGK
jgi:hypothetical protein